MVSRTVVSFVSMWDVLAHIGFSEEEVNAIAEIGLSGVSYGDAIYTLIGNNYALSLIQESIATFYDEGSVNLPHLYTAEEIAEMFWGVVGQDDYINVE